MKSLIHSEIVLSRPTQIVLILILMILGIANIYEPDPLVVRGERGPQEFVETDVVRHAIGRARGLCGSQEHEKGMAELARLRKIRGPSEVAEKVEKQCKISQELKRKKDEYWRRTASITYHLKNR